MIFKVNVNVIAIYHFIWGISSVNRYLNFFSLNVYASKYAKGNIQNNSKSTFEHVSLVINKLTSS